MSDRYIAPPASIPPGSVVDAYLRDSGGEGQDRSVDSQLIELRQWVNKNSFVLRRVYKDTRTGKSAAGRDGFETMVIDYDRGDIPDGLILWDYARFARNARDAVYYIAKIENHGVVIHSLTDNIPDGEYKELVRLVKHMGNQAEREKNGAASRRELHQLVRNHGAMFSQPPRGMKREPLPPTRNERTGELRQHHRWVPDPELRHLVLRAFQMRDAGASMANIHAATGLYKNLGGYTTFFTNKIYKGVLEFGGEDIPNYCEAIVPAELWDRVNVIRKRSRPGNGVNDPRRARSVYLLSGLIRCQECGQPMVGHRIKRWRYYACLRRRNSRGCTAAHIPKEKIEGDILRAIADRTLSVEYLSGLQTRVAKQLEESRVTIEGLSAQVDRDLNTVSKEISNFIRAIGKHGHSDSLLAALRAAETQKAELELKRMDLQMVPTMPHRHPDELERVAARIRKIIDGDDQDEQRSLCRSLITSVMARKDQGGIWSSVKYVPAEILKHPAGRGELGIVGVPPRELWGEDLIELYLPSKSLAK